VEGTEKNRFSLLDNFGKIIGNVLRTEKFGFSSFGDSPVLEENLPDADMIDDENQMRKLFKGEIAQASPLEETFKEDFKDISKNENYNPKYEITHFIDGSLRTKYIGEIMGNDGSGGPLVVGNIGAVSSIVDYSIYKVKLNNLKTKLIFYIPDILPSTTFSRINNMLENSENIKKFLQINVETLSLSESKGDLKYNAQTKTRSKMHDLEIELAKEIDNKNKKWVVVDGALRKSEFWNLKNTIGVAKSFGTKIQFLGMGSPRNISFLAKMRRGQRSKVFRYKLIKNQKEESEEQINFENIAFWYLKIRQAPPEMEPLGGIVKIDIKYSEKDADKITEIADHLSYAILKVSDPSIFPRPRWPSFIYPIRICEEYLSSVLLSQEEFLRLGVAIKKVMQNG
jgi:hypothetical protein